MHGCRTSEQPALYVKVTRPALRRACVSYRNESIRVIPGESEQGNCCRRPPKPRSIGAVWALLEYTRTVMTTIFWSEFGILFAGALIGGLAVMPYSLKLLKAPTQSKPVKMSVPTLLLLSFFQTAVLSAIAIGVGLLAARAIGLGAPYFEADLAGNGSMQAVALMLRPAVGLGLLGGSTLLMMDLLFLPHLPEALLDTARKTTLWQNFAASFYGGINEEVLMRLFGLSVLTWLLSRVWHTSAGLPTQTVFWTVNAIMAVLFGLGHLPAVKGLLGRITLLMLARTLLLNAPIGLICGWLFWRHGIEAAVVAHFSADIVYHVGGTILLRLNDQYHFVSYLGQ